MSPPAWKKAPVPVMTAARTWRRPSSSSTRTKSRWKSSVKAFAGGLSMVTTAIPSSSAKSTCRFDDPVTSPARALILFSRTGARRWRMASQLGLAGLPRVLRDRSRRKPRQDPESTARDVEPYAKCGSDVIRGAARNLAEKYRALSASLDGQLEWLRYLDSESRAGREPEPGTAEALLDKGVARKDEAAQAAAVAAVQGLDVVVEMRDGKPTGRLRLTRAERKKLEAAILGKFGETIPETVPGTENDFATNAAAGWYRCSRTKPFGRWMRRG